MRNKKNTILVKAVLLFLVTNFGNNLLAQYQQKDTQYHKYVNQTIYRFGNSFIKGTERLSIKELRKEFSMSELWFISYEKSKKYRTTSRVFGIASMAAGLVTIGVLANGNNRDLATGFLAGQIVLSLGSMRYMNLSNQSLDKALWQRNKDLLFPKSQ